MTLVSPGWRRALALLVAAQGGSHLVLLRPGFDGANFPPLILFDVAVLGFTIAGIGVAGLKPFTAAVRPLLVLASGYSLVLIIVNGAGRAPWVPVLDGVLLLTGLTGWHGRLPTGASHPGLPHRAAVSVSAAFLLILAYIVIWRRV